MWTASAPRSERAENAPSFDTSGRAGGKDGGARATIREVYDRLYAAYGPQHWWPGDGPFEVIVGAILTQSAAWTNVEKALANLKAAGVLSPAGIAETPERELAALLRPSGYYNAKGRKLKAFVALLDERFGSDLGRLVATSVEELRPLLLETYGIGPETSDSILLYAAERPVFVIDAYTRRVFGRLGYEPQSHAYDAWQRSFEEALPPDAAMLNEYHALIVRVAKEHCRKAPVCGGCPLLDLCPTGRAAQGAAGAAEVVTECCEPEAASGSDGVVEGEEV